MKIRKFSHVATALLLSLGLMSTPQSYAQTALETQRVETRDDGFDYGWIGLLGLAGLAGLKRRDSADERTRR